MRRSPHDPARLRTYLQIHHTRMEQFRGRGIVRADSLRFDFLPGLIRNVGEIGCLGRILVTVDQTLVIVGGQGPSALVQTVDYAYNASVQGYGCFLRYDNAHPHPGHPDPHHRHDLDWKTDRELPGSPSWCGVLGWPTLSGFLEQVETWYWENRDELPEPDGVAEIGRRTDPGAPETDTPGHSPH